MYNKSYPIPKNLNECFNVLDDIFKEATEDLEWFTASSEDEAVSGFHSGLGTWIRNTWGLWSKDTELYNVFNEMSLWHADDMYSLIMTSYYRKIHGKELNLKEQIQQFVDSWRDYEKMNGPIDKS